MIDFKLSDKQQALRNLAKEFSEKEIAPKAAYHDETREFPYEIVKKAYEIGLMNLTVEEKFGGGGLVVFESCPVTEEMSVACAGIGSIFNAGVLGVTPIMVAGTLEQYEGANQIQRLVISRHLLA